MIVTVMGEAQVGEGENTVTTRKKRDIEVDDTMMTMTVNASASERGDQDTRTKMIDDQDGIMRIGTIGEKGQGIDLGRLPGEGMIGRHRLLNGRDGQHRRHPDGDLRSSSCCSHIYVHV
jgi:hypothetical protein